MANRGRIRILVVDREPEWSAFVAKTLRKAGYEVRLEDDVDRVLGMLTGGESDLVLTDASLEAVIDAIAREGRDTRFVVFTTSPSVRQALDAYRHGALDYANKAFDSSTLLSIIRSALKKQPVSPDLVFC